MNLRDAMVGDLRSRAVLAHDPAARLVLVNRVLEGAGEVTITGPDWRDVIAFLDATMGSAPGRLAATLVASMKDPAVWIDLVTAARDWGDRRGSNGVGEFAPNSDGRVEIRKPVSNCICGGMVTDWFQPEGSPLNGRWFCVDCGLEWRWIDRARAGYRKDAPRFGGAPDQRIGLPISPPADPLPIKPARKLELKGREEIPTADKLESYWDGVWSRAKKEFGIT